MVKRMLVDAAHTEETRVVVVNGTKLEEFDVETSSKKQLKGNIYLAKVIRIEPSLQAAFVDYGGNRHGFLAFSEIHPDYYQIPIADREAIIAEQHAQRARQEAREEREAEERASRRARRAEAQAAARAPRDAQPMDGASEDGPAAPGDQQTGHDALAAADVVDVIATDNPAPRDDAARDTPAHEQRFDAPQTDADQTDTAERQAALARIAQDAVYDAPAASEAPAPLDRAPDYPLEPATAEASAGSGSVTADASNIAQIDDMAAAPETVETVGSAQADDEDDRDGGEGEEEEEEERPRRAPMMRNYKIQEVIKRRQIMLVQVVKEERGNKGAALTTYLSLAGRYCVLMPNAGRGGGISRKITNPADRKRMRDMLQELDVPQGTGVILRTAGLERSTGDIKRDYDYLARLWESVRDLTLKSTAPALIYEEGNLIKRSIRDLYDKEIEEIQVEGQDGFEAARDFMQQILPGHADKVRRYDEPIPLYHRYQVEGQLDAMHSPVVQLRSGGYIVINPTEALVAIDVNSGRSTRERNIEETAVRTNLEAAEEIARQLRLRDLAGLIVIDFIDMEESRHQQQVERRLKESMRVDRARIQIGRISHFGLLELSRQRLRPALHESATEPCAHCEGSGRIRSTESTALHVLRAIEEEGIRRRSSEITVAVPTHVALYLLNQKRVKLSDIEKRYGFIVTIAGDDTLIPPNFRIERVKTRALGELAQAPAQVATAQYDVPADAVDDTQAHEDDRDEAVEAPVGDEPEREEFAGERNERNDRGDRGDQARRGRRRRGGRGRDRDRNGGNRPYDANVEQPEVGAAGLPTTTQDPGYGESPPPDGESQAPRALGESQAPRPPGEAGESEEEQQRRRRRGRRGGRRRRRFDERPGEEGQRDPLGANAGTHAGDGGDHGQPANATEGGHQQAVDRPVERAPRQERQERQPRQNATPPAGSEERSRIISNPDAERVVEASDKAPEPKRGWWQRLIS